MENRNLQWNKRVKVPLILIFSVNTNHESVAYRSFSPSKFEARGARKVTTGIDCQKTTSPRLYSLVESSPTWPYCAGHGTGNTPGCGELSPGLGYRCGVNDHPPPSTGDGGKNSKVRDNPQLSWLPAMA